MNVTLQSATVGNRALTTGTGMPSYADTATGAGSSFASSMQQASGAEMSPVQNTEQPQDGSVGSEAAEPVLKNESAQGVEAAPGLSDGMGGASSSASGLQIEKSDHVGKFPEAIAPRTLLKSDGEAESVEGTPVDGVSAGVESRSKAGRQNKGAAIVDGESGPAAMSAASMAQNVVPHKNVPAEYTSKSGVAMPTGGVDVRHALSRATNDRPIVALPASAVPETERSAAETKGNSAAQTEALHAVGSTAVAVSPAQAAGNDDLPMSLEANQGTPEDAVSAVKMAAVSGRALRNSRAASQVAPSTVAVDASGSVGDAATVTHSALAEHAGIVQVALNPAAVLPHPAVFPVASSVPSGRADGHGFSSGRLEAGTGSALMGQIASGSNAAALDRRGGLEVGFHDTTLGWLSVRASVDSAGDLHASVGGRSENASNVVATMLPALGRFLQDHSVAVQSVSGTGTTVATGMWQPNSTGLSDSAAFSQQGEARQGSGQQQRRDSPTSWSDEEPSANQESAWVVNAAVPSLFAQAGRTSTLSVRI